MCMVTNQCVVRHVPQALQCDWSQLHPSNRLSGLIVRDYKNVRINWPNLLGRPCSMSTERVKGRMAFTLNALCHSMWFALFVHTFDV